MSPLHNYTEECAVPIFGNWDPGIVREFFEGAIEVVSWGFGSQGKLVEKLEQAEGRACLDDLLRSRIKSVAKELNVGCDSTRAAAVLDRHFVNPVCVQDEEGGVAGDGVFAKHAGVVELDFQAEGFEGDFNKL
jgi:hypothetical protein